MTDKAGGALLGLACGDALGRPVEFKSRRRIRSGYGRVTEMLADGTHSKPAGTITDDTEQALAIARSLDECGDFDGEDIAARFVEWYRSGPFDIGLTTSAALRKLDDGVEWTRAGELALEERGAGAGAGNGSVMRAAPIAVAYADDRDRLVEVSRDTSRITHADERCTDGAAALNVLIAEYLNGGAEPLEAAIDWLSASHGDTSREVLSRLRGVAGEPKADDELPNGGYVVDTLEAALTVALDAETFEEAVVRAVNLGGDTDTTGAVAGAVAGARFGATEVPDRWLEHIDEEEELRGLARRLNEF